MRSWNFVAVSIVCGTLGTAQAFARDAASNPGSTVDPGAAALELADSEPAGEKLKLTILSGKDDLERHQIDVSMNRPAARVVVKVYDEDGALITEKTEEFQGAPAGKSLRVSWEQSSSRKIAKVEVFGYDTEEHWVGVSIIPWSLKIPHDEVLFDSDSAKIQDAELPKLQTSLASIRDAVAKYSDIGPVKLFIIGHTDTVGTASYNEDLSRRRARAIAKWFVDKGLTIPVAYEGFGESWPLVPTKDEVAEPKNRRVDYIMSVDIIRLKSGETPNWKWVNK